VVVPRTSFGHVRRAARTVSVPRNGKSVQHFIGFAVIAAAGTCGTRLNKNPIVPKRVAICR
jgi:hypothetical protein